MTRVLILCLAALALVVAGCGGDGDGGGGGEVSEAEYEKQVSQAGEALDKAFSDIGTSISGSGSTEEAATELEEGAEALDKAAADLGDITPPSDIEEPHGEVVEGLEKLADEFREGAQAAESGNTQKLLEFATQLQSSEAVKQIQEAGEAIEKQGYDFSSGS